MSLDIYFTKTKTLNCECGKVHELETETVFDHNITHNLTQMAAAAGIYNSLWNPSSIGITKAEQLGKNLKIGIDMLKSDPVFYDKFSSSNGWGTYNQFVPWLEEVYEACLIWPDAGIIISK